MPTHLKHAAQSDLSPGIGGLVAATLTPFDRGGAIDTARLQAHVETLFADGCDLVVIFGSTGEGASIASATKLDALRALLAGGLDPARIILGVMETDMHAARRMIGDAAELRIRAVLLLPPYYYPASEDGVFDFLARACGGRDPGVDVILYHIPQLARAGFSPALIRRLRDFLGPRLAGIKDSTGSQAHTLGLVHAFPDLPVFTGTDTDLPPLLDAGGAGMIGGLPNINARGLRIVVDGHGPEREAASAVASRILHLVDERGGIAALKAIAAVRYADDEWLHMLPPLRPLDEMARAALLADAAAVGYEVPDRAI